MAEAMTRKATAKARAILRFAQDDDAALGAALKGNGNEEGSGDTKASLGAPKVRKDWYSQIKEKEQWRRCFGMRMQMRERWKARRLRCWAMGARAARTR
jgi:hypothetical protein